MHFFHHKTTRTEKTMKKIAIIVANVITTELLRNGHKCVKPGNKAEADFVLDGFVYRYWVSVDTGFATYMSTAKVEVFIKLTPKDVARDNFKRAYR